MTRRPWTRWLAAVLTGLTLLAPALPAAAQEFPVRPIKVVVPYPPGVTDQEARALAAAAEKTLGQPVQVENREGGGGAIGANVVAKSSRPDGYTLLYAAAAVITIAPTLRKLPYGFEDLAPVAQITANPHLMAARPTAPFKTLAELIAHARANPGKVNFGSSGAGTAVHLAGEAFARKAGIQLNHIPFKGLNPAITAALGGHVDVVIGLPLAIMPLVEGGKLVPLAQFGAARSPVIPDVPTLREKGVELALATDIGFFGPRGIPAPVLTRLTTAFQTAVGSDEFQAFARKTRSTPLFRPPAEFARVLDSERKLWAELIPTLGLAKE